MDSAYQKEHKDMKAFMICTYNANDTGAWMRLASVFVVSKKLVSTFRIYVTIVNTMIVVMPIKANKMAKDR